MENPVPETVPVVNQFANFPEWICTQGYKHSTDSMKCSGHQVATRVKSSK